MKPPDAGSIRKPDEKLARLTKSVTSLESALQEFPPYEVRNAQKWALQWVPKAIVVCDALEASLAGPEAPERGSVIRGELSAHVLQKLPWKSLGVILGLDSEHRSLPELSTKIREFVEIVDASGTGQDLSEEVDILASYDAAVEAVRELRKQLNSVSSATTPEARITAEPVLGRRAPLDAGSLTESAMRIGVTVLACSTFGAPLGATIFHEPLLSAGAKAGITSLIGSTAAELVNHELRRQKQHSPVAVFDRCHDQLLTSLNNYIELTAGSSRELVVARAHLITDAYAARLATIHLDWPDKNQYLETVALLQNAIDHREEPQKLQKWLPRLRMHTQSLKDQIKESHSMTTGRFEPAKEYVVQPPSEPKDPKEGPPTFGTNPDKPAAEKIGEIDQGKPGNDMNYTKGV